MHGRAVGKRKAKPDGAAADTGAGGNNAGYGVSGYKRYTVPHQSTGCRYVTEGNHTIHNDCVFEVDKGRIFAPGSGECEASQNPCCGIHHDI